MRAQSVNRPRFVLGTVLVLMIFPVLAAENPSEYTVSEDLYYGEDPNGRDRQYQSLDLYWQDNAVRRPVIIYVHGGGWAFGDKSDVNAKPDFFVPRGIAFISMNYRLRWDYKVYHQLEDIVSVVKWVHRNSTTYGLDPSRVILMGNDAGGHLVSVIGTDSRYLRARELSLSDIRAVAAIETRSFDIPRIMEELGDFFERRHHRVIFGDDENVWRELSPLNHVRPGKNIPTFALMYASDDATESILTSDFAKKLTGASVGTILIPGQGGDIDEDLGSEENLPTYSLMAFIGARI